MEYSIYNILNEYVSNYGKNIIITFENLDNVDFYFDLKKIAHLMGLHYCNDERNNAGKEANNILLNKMNDDEIFKKIWKFNKKYLKAVIDRIDNISLFLKNLENARITRKSNVTNKSINSIYFLVQINKNKVLEIGLGKDTTDQYYLETFLVRNNDNNIDYSLNSKVLSIETYENDKLKYFSFDTEKQAKLDEVAKIDKNYDYHEALNKSIEEIKNEKQTINMWCCFRNRSYEDDWER